MAISVRALAHIGAFDLAVITTYGLLHFPYDADVAYTVRYMKDSLEHAGSPDALALAGEEHAAIVQALTQPGPLTATGSDAAISTGALYASAMELAFPRSFCRQFRRGGSGSRRGRCASETGGNPRRRPAGDR